MCVFECYYNYIGYTSLDGLAAFGLGTQPTTSDELYDYLYDYINDTFIVNELISYYYNVSTSENNEYFNKTLYGDSLSTTQWYAMNSDLCLGCPAYNAAKYFDPLIEQQFLYEFRGPTAPFLVYHAGELVYLFLLGDLFADAFGVVYNESLGLSMINAWTQFGIMDDDGLNFTLIDYNGFDKKEFKWNEYNYNNGEDVNDKNASVLIFSNRIYNYEKYEYNFRNNVCDYWMNNVDFETRRDICRHPERS